MELILQGGVADLDQSFSGVAAALGLSMSELWRLVLITFFNKRELGKACKGRVTLEKMGQTLADLKQP